MKRIFGERLKELRLEQECSIYNLSQKTGISTATISRWENGIQDITGDNLIILAKYFKVSTDFLLGLED